MALHLLKLSVGSECLDDLRAFAARSSSAIRGAGGPDAARITTRMAPKRADEVLDGGSLYWVVKGSLLARQPVVGFEPFKDADGIGRVWIYLAPEVTPVRSRPCRPFQGWRYLTEADAPRDVTLTDADRAIPAAMRRELQELCLI